MIVVEALLRELETKRAIKAELCVALEKCRDRFAEYAELHRRKLGSQRNGEDFAQVLEKVGRNKEMADLCIAALAKAKGEQ